ncbi:hypothetical protein, partial [Aneurinibacillus tyrosinisolvens]|uniref:hypothetical protein n=1 Tax=Aneurinibacillus tyrosinisolvens TaxID=1443435 RepID=UPI00063F8338
MVRHSLKGKKSSKKAAEPTDFISLKAEIEQFIEYANHQYYLAPNRVVPKKDRPKWRFTVKRVVNQLMQFAEEPQYAGESACLLESLYKLICRACSEYLFNTEDPFRSIMIDQLDFFRSVVALKKKVESPEKWISDSILLIIDCETDRELARIDLMGPLWEVAEEKWLKELLIKQCDLLLQAYLRERKEIQEKQGTKIKKSGWSFPSSPDMHIQRKIENLVLMVLMAHFNMDNYKAGIDYFKKYYV